MRFFIWPWTSVLFQVVPLAAVVSDKVKSLSLDASATKAQETRAIKAEADMKSARDLIEVMGNQADVITTERDGLQTEVQRLKTRLERRTSQLRESRKALKKEKKLLERSEERFFLCTHDLMVRRVTEAAWTTSWL